MNGVMMVLLVWLVGWAIYGGSVVGLSMMFVNIWTFLLMVLLAFLDHKPKIEVAADPLSPEAQKIIKNIFSGKPKDNEKKDSNGN